MGRKVERGREEGGVSVKEEKPYEEEGRGGERYFHMVDAESQ